MLENQRSRIGPLPKPHVLRASQSEPSVASNAGSSNFMLEQASLRNEFAEQTRWVKQRLIARAARFKRLSANAP